MTFQVFIPHMQATEKKSAMREARRIAVGEVGRRHAYGRVEVQAVPFVFGVGNERSSGGWYVEFPDVEAPEERANRVQDLLR